jgi:2,4-dienoyl-CoA reductase-like NADH-dependent reductase (Old Yellow Enzyme family)
VAPSLTDPIRLPCGQTLANRLVKPALNEALGDRRGAPTPRLEALFRRWGRGGCGLLITGNVVVDRRHVAEPGNVAVEDGRELDALRRWAAAGREHGARVWMQINHPGRQAHPVASRARPVAPSALPAGMPGARVPDVLGEAEIAGLVRRFATTAAVAQAAGFDGVQLHAAHGYLISQFLSPLANVREDGWGGDPERRMRFILEVTRAVRAAVGDAFPVAVKLNSTDFLRGGFTEAESQRVVERLVTEGVDLVEVSGGTYEAPAMMGAQAASTREREAYFLAYAESVRRRAGDVPLMVTGGFRSRAAMADAVARGACDLVGVGRPLCLDPDAAHELLSGRRDRIDAGDVRLGLRPVIGRLMDLRAADSALDVQWHTDQIHRIAAGGEPDPGRAWWRTLGRAVLRSGRGALHGGRGLSASPRRPTARPAAPRR